jgi:hypothetical protein
MFRTGGLDRVAVDRLEGDPDMNDKEYDMGRVEA